MTVAHTEEGEWTVSQSPTGNRAAATERAILAGGCFWGMQDLIRKMKGVKRTRVGYTGGDVPNATYRNHGTHAEALEVEFDPTTIDVAVNGVWICRAGGIGEDRDLVDLSGREVEVVIDLKAGEAEATILTNDLTHDYVHENSAYSS